MWPFPQSPTQRLRHNLAHADGFRHRLETDRLRADRMGIALTLVTVSWRNGDDAAEATARVFDVVHERLRATDEIGRLSDREIAIVLWDTDEDGAKIFVDRLLRAAPEDLGLEATLFVYPRRQPDDHDRSNDPPTADVRDDGQAGEAVADEPIADALAVERLEPAMAVPIHAVRRAIDLVGASVGLLLAAPILGAAALAIRIADPGPVLFRQRRAGLGGRPFEIFKLRTMCVDADAKKAALLAESEQDGAAFKLTNDPRVFPVGSFLRKSSIDELPQLLNVLRGEMSLVGPRPLPIEEAERVAGWQRRRLDVQPGLTCIWQVEGRSRVSFVEWMRMDMKYIRRQGVLQDLQLMFATVPAVLLRRGAK